MEAIGFIFGMAGLSFALIAKGQIDSLKIEFDELKNRLEESGTLTAQVEPE